ncbi:spermidine synthase [Planctomonas psychrotolerans]|uniref:spermidine synthase n=1 Tax=Planctomonas psychrotolerans TaxID=2528712 RepID=UPI00123C3F03|nr:fused MFS/spermidine synthase [Planctomonas psychrotolerans]
MNDSTPEVQVSAGTARLETDRHSPGSLTLVVDGTPQSHVDVDDPSHLSFEYVRRIGHLIDLVAPEGESITAVHLGAGALTLPRYVAHTRPGSRQQVVELERGLVDMVREAAPFPRAAQIRLRYGDAREVLAKLPEGLRGSADLVVVDIFSGARTPAHVTSVEFYREVIALLAPSGILAVNVADGAGLTFARSQLSTVAHLLPHVAALADTQMLKGRRFGNIVVAASATPLPTGSLPRLLAGDSSPAKMVDGRELTDFIAGAPVVTDATAVPSPPPARSIFQTGRGSSTW